MPSPSGKTVVAKKIIPGFTITAAWELNLSGVRWPRSDFKSERWPDLLPNQLAAKRLRRANLSRGNRGSSLAVSIRIPRKVALVLGPSNVFRDTGTCRYSKTPKVVSRNRRPSSVKVTQRSKSHPSKGLSTWPPDDVKSMPMNQQNR